MNIYFFKVHVTAVEMKHSKKGVLTPSAHHELYRVVYFRQQ